VIVLAAIILGWLIVQALAEAPARRRTELETRTFRRPGICRAQPT